MGDCVATARAIRLVAKSGNREPGRTRMDTRKIFPNQTGVVRSNTRKGMKTTHWSGRFSPETRMPAASWSRATRKACSAWHFCIAKSKSDAEEIVSNRRSAKARFQNIDLRESASWSGARYSAIHSQPRRAGCPRISQNLYSLRPSLWSAFSCHFDCLLAEEFS
jgi:hypothetical protein